MLEYILGSLWRHGLPKTPEELVTLPSIIYKNQPLLVKLFIDIVQQVIGTPPVWESYL